MIMLLHIPLNTDCAKQKKRKEKQKLDEVIYHSCNDFINFLGFIYRVLAFLNKLLPGKMSSSLSTATQKLLVV